MGKTVRTVTVCSCDVCNRVCEDDENKIDVTFSYSMDSRNYIYGSIYAYIPYGTTAGIVCRECKLSLLEEYIKKERLSD